MLCKKPYMLGALPCGCGQCLPCRINRRRLWSHRMVLESVKHAENAFVTLTYSDRTLPSGSTLNPKDPQKWLKRLRKELHPQKIRFYLAGEYGEQNRRPHYHAAIFGLDPITGGGSEGTGGIVHETWCRKGCDGKDESGCYGYTYTGDLTPQSASYICGYVTKKLGKEEYKAFDLHPEFSRMSLRPGIGAHAMKDVAGALEEHLTEEIFRLGKIYQLRHGKKLMPLGRYLSSILRQELGYGREKTDEEKMAIFEKMRQLYEDEKVTAAAEKRPIKYYEKSSLQPIRNLVNRFKIHDKKGVL